LRDARTQRLLLANAAVPAANWVALLLLGLLAQVAIATVHTGQPRPMALALVIFSVGMAVATGVVAVNDRPFTGQEGLPPTALVETLRDPMPH
jgi:hypothetical protein